MKEVLINKQIGSDWWEEGITRVPGLDGPADEQAQDRGEAAGEDDHHAHEDNRLPNVFYCQTKKGCFHQLNPLRRGKHEDYFLHDFWHDFKWYCCSGEN